MATAYDGKIKQAQPIAQADQAIRIVRSKKTVILWQLADYLVHHGGLVEGTVHEKDVFSHG